MNLRIGPGYLSAKVDNKFDTTHIIKPIKANPLNTDLGI